MPKRATSARDLILGLLFFGGLFGLAVVTTQLTNASLTGGRHHITVLFEDIYGIQREDKVLVYGTRYGRVRRVEPVPAEAWAAASRDLTADGLVAEGKTFTPHVMAVLELEYDVDLNSEYQIFAEDSNLLGGKVISILPGTPGEAPLKMARPEDGGSFEADNAQDLAKIALIGTPRPHPITAIGKLVENNLDDLDSFVDNLVEASNKLNDPKAGLVGYALNDPAAIEKVDGILDDIREFSGRANAEGHLLSDLTRPSKLRDDVLASVDSVKTFTDSLNQPDTIIGGLTNADSPMKRRLDTILDNGEQFTAKLNREDSLVGKALASGPDSLGNRVEGTIDRISDAADNIGAAAGQVRTWVDKATTNPESLLYQIAEGDLGSSVRNAIDGIDRAVAGFNEYIIDPISRNESLAGLVFNDPDIRKKVDRMISATLGIIEDAREAAPVTSLGSFIFGGF